MPNKNVILITIDCLRPDHLSCYGYQYKTSPFIDKIAEEGCIFKNAFANGSSTPASFPSIITSTYALSYPDYPEISDERKNIAQILKKNNYITGGFNSNPYLSRYYNYNKGFIKFEDMLSEEKKQPKKLSKFKNTIKKYKLIHLVARKIDRLLKYPKLFLKTIKPPYKRINQINKDVIKWLKDIQELNFFLWVHYMDSHHPFIPTKPFRTNNNFRINRSEKLILKNPRKLKKGALRTIKNIYDNTIKSVDYYLKLFFKKLEKLGLIDNTLFIITSDHGEEFKEHGGFSHKAKLFDELIHVPLIVMGPNIKTQTEIDNLVSLIDLSPTILDYLDIPKNSNFLGKSFLSLISNKINDKNNYHREGIISETLIKNKKISLSISNAFKLISYRNRNWKLIINYETREKRLYNLRKDAAEKTNLYSEKQNIAIKLEKEIINHNKMQCTNLNHFKEIANIKRASKIL